MSNYRKQKGDNAEHAVRVTLEAQGFVVRNGAQAESGCDLFIFTPTGQLVCEAEVKYRKESTVNGLQPKDKRSLARRARENRALNWPYRLYFIDSRSPQVASRWIVGELGASQGRNGLHLDLFEDGLLNLLYPANRPLKGLKAPPLPSRAESGAAVRREVIAKPETSAPPAKPSASPETGIRCANCGDVTVGEDGPDAACLGCGEPLPEA